MHPPNNVLGPSCTACVHDQPCCTNRDINPLPLLAEDLPAYGRENVEPWPGAKGVFRAIPGDGGDRDHLTSDGCRLGSKRPVVCRAYPILYDGETWRLDAQCPAASLLVYRAAFSESDESRFMRNAVKRLLQHGKLLKVPVAQITERWRYSLVIDKASIPRKLLEP